MCCTKIKNTKKYEFSFVLPTRVFTFNSVYVVVFNSLYKGFIHMTALMFNVGLYIFGKSIKIRHIL